MLDHGQLRHIMKLKCILHFAKYKTHFIGCQLFFHFLKKIWPFFDLAVLYLAPTGVKTGCQSFFFSEVPDFFLLRCCSRGFWHQCVDLFPHLADAFSQIPLQKYPIQEGVNTRCYMKLHEMDMDMVKRGLF